MGILNKHELEKRLSTLVCLFQMFWTMNKNPNQIMNDIIKLRHSSNGDTYKFHRIFPLDFYVAILTFIPIVDRHPCKKGSELNAYSMSSSLPETSKIFPVSNHFPRSTLGAFLQIFPEVMRRGSHR